MNMCSLVRRMERLTVISADIVIEQTKKRIIECCGDGVEILVLQ
jgi:hypothetical protein